MIPSDAIVKVDSAKISERYKELYAQLPHEMLGDDVAVELSAHLTLAVELQCKLAGLDGDVGQKILQRMTTDLAELARDFAAAGLRTN